jgi:hypothetical protein
MPMPDYLSKGYLQLNHYISDLIVDYGGLVYNEMNEDNYDPKKHGKIVADMVTDIVSRVEDFTLLVVRDCNNQLRKRLVERIED